MIFLTCPTPLCSWGVTARVSVLFPCVFTSFMGPCYFWEWGQRLSPTDPLLMSWRLEPWSWSRAVLGPCCLWRSSPIHCVWNARHHVLPAWIFSPCDAACLPGLLVLPCTVSSSAGPSGIAGSASFCLPLLFYAISSSVWDSLLSFTLPPPKLLFRESLPSKN